MTGIGVLSKPVLPTVAAGAGAPTATWKRLGWFDGMTNFVETPIYSRKTLLAGQVFEGPAIVEQFDSTFVVPPSTRVTVEPHGSLILEFTA